VVDTVYANVVNFRMTPNEFVMEFGTFFPDKPNVTPPPPSEFKPTIRVVMNASVIEGLAQAIQQAAKARQSQVVAMKGGTGFVPGGGGGVH
jgi:hypothetical protein